jgi:PmbA protein
LEEILSLAKKAATEAEVFLISYEESPVVFEANRLKQLQTRQGTVVALRVIKEGRIGFSTATRLDDRQGLVKQALEVCQFGPQARLELPLRRSYPQVEVYDPEVEAVTPDMMVELGESLIARVRKYSPELVCEVGVTKDVTSVHILNSRGGEASYKKSIFSIGIEGALIRDTDMLFVGDSQSLCHPVRDVDQIAHLVIKQLELANRKASVSTGYLPVVFTPRGVVSTFIVPLAVAFNGRTVLQGASPVGNKLGEQIFDKRLSIFDDATIIYHPRSRPCDDEGTPSRRISLVENGKVMNFLYDLQTAGLANTQSTGSGDRSGGLPTPSVSALTIGQGDTPWESMIRELNEGLVVEQLIGAEQTNVLSGEFSGNVLLGYKVERGEVVGRVKDTMVSGNVYKALAELAAIGGETRWVGGTICTPAIFCPKLAVASGG